MYSNVKQVRRRGVRKSERDLANEPGVFGEITLFRVGGYPVLQVHAPGGFADGKDLYPCLHEAVCTGMRDCFLVWRGWQREGNQEDKNGPTYLQEWRVEIISMRAPQEAMPFSAATAGGG
ncbi:hypothetical protein [Janthinobacterium sp. NKUCC08_JDC]|uniref:hypothetical protein n=1 Tax=Janthinobacterium sp. NKUCC08_JDC TaxID=2842122 RepID=UPI001C5BE244|nr:hypothetical protein [Janthinobacterium sp. NKUCC08_JDC]MBW3498891.1 hypothetical protein [Janthinobacterium sp. NKUCC08_JDC]